MTPLSLCAVFVAGAGSTTPGAGSSGEAEAVFREALKQLPHHPRFDIGLGDALRAHLDLSPPDDDPVKAFSGTLQFADGYPVPGQAVPVTPDSRHLQGQLGFRSPLRFPTRLGLRDRRAGRSGALERPSGGPRRPAAEHSENPGHGSQSAQ